MNPLRTRRYPFYISIATLVVAVIASLSGVFLWISDKESSATAISLADRLFTEVNDKVAERYENALQSVSILATSASLMPAMTRRPEKDGLSHPGLAFMVKALESFDYLLSMYAGYEDGSFIQVTASRGHAGVNVSYGAPENTFYIIRTISPDPNADLRQCWTYMDRNRNLIASRLERGAHYDPRRRPWYIDAVKAGETVYTDPYIFSATKLETIYNRIHKIRTRFEILWRDAEIDYYKKCLGTGENEADPKQPRG